jgi:hypothetical protein
VFLVNVPVVALAIGCTAAFVPETRAPRARRFDPVGQLLVVLALGSLVYAIIESGRSGWASTAALTPLAVFLAATLSVLAYEPHRTDPLVELRFFRSIPFSSSILMALIALCGFSSFLFVTMLYLETVRGMSALAAGLSFLPVGILIVALSPQSALGVAIAGTIVDSTAAPGARAFTDAGHGVWVMVTGLGVALICLAWLSTGRRAMESATRAAARFDDLDRVPQRQPADAG